MRKIDFIVAGAQKSGTTALDFYLRQHPSICMGNQKEIHFFDNEENFKTALDYKKYHENFSIEEKHKVIGEATPIYMYWDNAIRRIWEYNKKIKVVVILRNPIERAYSHWNMEVNRAAEKFSFQSAIRNEALRTKEALPYKHRVYSYIDRGFYSEQIRNIYRYFDRADVFVIRYEKLREYPLETLNELFRFLSVSTLESIKIEAVHCTKYKNKMAKPEWNYLRDAYKNSIHDLEDMLGWDCSNWIKPPEAKKVLFYRDFRRYAGGHQKVYDYFTHFAEHEDYKVDICFSKDTLWDKSNPWLSKYKENHKYSYKVDGYDILFIAGMDWELVPEGAENKITVINFIQGLRHSNSNDQRYKYLKRKAIRICVSNEVAEAIRQTGVANGPIYTIENGVKLKEIKREKEFDVYILGLKNPKMAKRLNKKLSKLGYSVKLSVNLIPKDEVHFNMSNAKISLLLPNYKVAEGFYLPALESMKYSDLTIVPDCIGNRSFCKHKVNCLMPKYEKKDFIKYVQFAEKVLNDADELNKFKAETKKTLDKHSLDNERNFLYEILSKIEQYV